MAGSIVKMAVQLTANANGFVTGISSGRWAVRAMQRDLHSMGNAARGAMAVFGVGISIAGVKALAGQAYAVSDAAEGIVRQAERMSVAPKEFRALAFAASQAGMEIEGLQKPITWMMKNLSGIGDESKKASASLSIIGLTAEKLRILGPMGAIEAIAGGLSKISDPFMRTGIVMSLFGKQGSQVLALLTQGSDKLRASMQQGRELGGFISDHEIRQAADYHDSIKRLNQVLDTAKMKAMAFFSPYLVAGVDAMIKRIVSSSQNIFSAIEKGMISTAKWIDAHIDKISTYIKLLSGAAGAWMGGKMTPSALSSLPIAGWISKTFIQTTAGATAITALQAAVDHLGGGQAIWNGVRSFFRDVSKGALDAKNKVIDMGGAISGVKTTSEMQDYIEGMGRKASGGGSVKGTYSEYEKLVSLWNEQTKAVERYNNEIVQLRVQLDSLSGENSPENMIGKGFTTEDILKKSNKRKRINKQISDLIANAPRVDIFESLQDDINKVVGKKNEDLVGDFFTKIGKYAEDFKSAYDSVMSDIETPFDKYKKSMDKINSLYDMGAINGDQYTTAQTKYWDELTASAEKYNKELDKATGKGEQASVAGETAMLVQQSRRNEWYTKASDPSGGRMGGGNFQGQVGGSWKSDASGEDQRPNTMINILQQIQENTNPRKLQYAGVAV